MKKKIAFVQVNLLRTGMLMLLGTWNPVQPWKPLHRIHPASKSEPWPMVAMRGYSTHPSAVPIRKWYLRFYCVFALHFSINLFVERRIRRSLWNLKAFCQGLGLGQPYLSDQSRKSDGVPQRFRVYLWQFNWCLPLFWKHFCLKWLFKSSKQAIISPLAPLNSAGVEPSRQQLFSHQLPMPKVLPEALPLAA